MEHLVLRVAAGDVNTAVLALVPYSEDFLSLRRRIPDSCVDAALDVVNSRLDELLDLGSVVGVLLGVGQVGAVGGADELHVALEDDGLEVVVGLGGVVEGAHALLHLPHLLLLHLVHAAHHVTHHVTHLAHHLTHLIHPTSLHTLRLCTHHHHALRLLHHHSRLTTHHHTLRLLKLLLLLLLELGLLLNVLRDRRLGWHLLLLLFGRRISAEVKSEKANADFSVGLAVLEEAPLVRDNTLGEAGDGDVVLAHEVIGEGVGVPESHLKLSGVGVGDEELEDLIPLWVLSVVTNISLVNLVFEFNLDVGIGTADHLHIRKVASFNDTNVNTTHDYD